MEEEHYEKRSGQVSEWQKEQFEKHNYINKTVRVTLYQITTSILLRAQSDWEDAENDVCDFDPAHVCKR